MNPRFPYTRRLCAVFISVLISAVFSFNAQADPLPILPGSWTLAILPDTQNYAQSYPDIYTAQTQWIADHAISHNIKMVLHEGDIVNSNVATQWNNAIASMRILDGVVPYAMAPGNHDYSSNRSTLFNSNDYFGSEAPYATQSTVGGFFEAGKTDNSYHTFNDGGTDWLVLALEYGPRNQVVDWANQVVADHPDHKAILVTHAYMYDTEVRYDWAIYGDSQTWNPHDYTAFASLPGGVNDGQELWDKLVKLHDNFAFVFSGHVLHDGTGFLSSVGDHGNVVHQMLANYQMDTMGGNGYMRLLEFLADGETVEVRTYSPVTNEYMEEYDQMFTLNRNEVHPPLEPEPPTTYYHAIGANLVFGGPADPSTNTFNDVSIPQSAFPGVGTLQVNTGDFEVSVDGNGLIYQHGVLLASITQNVRDGIRATVEVGRNSFSDGLMALSIMQAGNSAGNEVNVNTSVAWFMFNAGWQGAHVNPDGTIAAFHGVTQNMVTRTGTGRYTINLGAQPTAEDGMLFAIANNNGNTVVNTRIQTDGTWDLRVQDNGVDMVGEDANFSFLFLPYDTEGLIGGRYDGASDTHIASAGDFTMEKLGVGRYQLNVTGETSETGMLIMTVADNFGSLPDDNFLTYEADGVGNFLIEARDLPVLSLEDTQFVWAFISFDDPIAMPSTVTDIRLTVDRDTGNLTLKNFSSFEVGIRGYSILSSGGALDPADWTPVAGRLDGSPTGDGTVDSDDPWTIVSDPNSHTDLSESELSGGDGGLLGIDQAMDLGNAWIQSRIEDLIVALELTDGKTVYLHGSFVGGPGGQSYVRSDLNTDGSITADDWLLFYPNTLADLSSLSLVETALAGDLDNDGDNDLFDFEIFKADFEAANGSGSFAQMLAGVPEPASWILLVLGFAVVLKFRDIFAG